jgi:hypothetical protein
MSYTKRYGATLAVNVPAAIAELVETAAKKQFTNSSTYVRQAVARSLKADGFDLEAA